MPAMIDIAAPFSYGRLRDALTLLEQMAAGGMGIEDLRREVVRREDARKKPVAPARRLLAEIQKKTPRCPQCGRPMALHAGDDNDCHWVCKHCRHSTYCPRPAQDELQRIMTRKET